MTYEIFHEKAKPMTVCAEAIFGPTPIQGQAREFVERESVVRSIPDWEPL